ncbi:MucBP domain-containing protein [Pseudoflavonifractor sp. An187]|uniref:MucBP domain-containing protein n=1 Tax=Pseudoflavonifractor sp. An187 TaxID=1965578 RepID=UPI00117A9915|nr:MucBP domain-containing protein [Pseudoflavonifractor sp. An187]
MENFIWSEGRTMKKRWERLIAAVMSVVMVQTVCPPQAMALAASEVKEAAEYLEVDQLFSTTQSAVTTDSPENVETQTSAALFQDGAVRIYHALQLYAIGSNAVVHSGDAQAETFGTGTVLTDENGQVLLYDSDGSYQLMNDIELPEGATWALPSGFSGTFVSEGESTEAPLYDEDTDTIYIYNNYQLLTRAAEDELKTVLSGDNVAETFGLGQVVYAGDQQLEYTQDHNYVVAQSFTAQMPELKAEEILSETTQDATPGLDGRDYLGQVVYNDSATGLQYILIGNKQQLQAIGKTEREWQMVGFLVQYVNVAIKVTEPLWEKDGREWKQVYPGDADLSSDQKLWGNDDFYHTIGQKYYGSKLVNGQVVCDESATKYHVNIERNGKDEPTYSTNANYIIFRDINLNYEEWTPLAFHGTMIGAKTDGTSKIWDDTGIVASKRPEISRIIVTMDENEQLEVDKQLGVGFFSTISSEMNEKNVGVSSGQVIVSNLILDDVSVQTLTNKTKDSQSLLNAITSGVGGILGELLDNLLNILTFGKLNLNLNKVLGGLLNARAKDPTRFATGAFAGRIEGDVKVYNCDVIGADVKNINDFTGGFAGYSIGTTKYDGLSEALGDIERLLTNLLNIIPGIGLGDLITILLRNGLAIGHLIPTGYYRPHIENCTVSLKNGAGSLGNATSSYVGGFVGKQVGTVMDTCTVSGLKSVTANDYAGGFAGATMDALIRGLLTKLGGNISYSPSTENTNCTVQSVVNSSEDEQSETEATLWTITGTNYVGGYTGMTANSNIVNSTVKNLGAVTASGDYAAGFVGRATVGSGALSLGEDENTLLGQIGKLTGDLTGMEGAVLELFGAAPSRFNNCKILDSTLSVQAGNYAGGFIGQGDGVQINQEGGTTTLKNVASITSTKNYSGGFAGQLIPTNAGGALNKVLGFAAIREPVVSNVDVWGADGEFAVTANENYAGGAIGVTVGGQIQNVTVSNLQKVAANAEKGIAGGFLGSNNASGLVNAGGLNLLNLDILKVSNLLKVVNYLLTDCTNCYVSFTGNATPQVSAASAGGFVGEMYGGSVNNSDMTDNRGAVRNLSNVQGTYYAGGFAGKICSGNLADASGGIELAGLKVDVTGLTGVLQGYVPKVTSADVSSAETGLKVQALKQTMREDNTTVADKDSGAAGGYAGLVRGAQISYSDVNALATRGSFKSEEVSNSDWAVKAPAYAGGYAGKIDLGSLATVGDSVSLLDIVGLDGILSALSVVESRLEQCDVTGKSGGFNVKASNVTEEKTVTSATVGSAGGFAGEINGAWLNGCDAGNYEYIEGVVSAGGYAGTVQPGDMVSLLEGQTNILEIVNASGLLSALKTFIPRIYNSSTAAVPCGGYIEATGTSVDEQLKGMAGGYVGYNQGGRIWGNVKTDPADVSKQPAVLKDQKTATTHRVREVVGVEFAGGFTGLMESANLVDSGSLKLLPTEEGGAVAALSVPVSALQVVYPTETNTQTTGPLRGLNKETWNAWVTAVGSSGVYGEELVQASYGDLAQYIYGYTVTAKAEDEGSSLVDGGAAGGYVGRMEAGVITNAYAQDVKAVTAFRSAGGFAGEMETGSVANVGSIKIAEIDVTGNLPIVKSFVPVVYASRVDGYQSGMTIKTTSDTENSAIGNAGGFVGVAYGAQLWREIPKDEDLDFVRVTEQAAEVQNLKYVYGSQYAGGFAGRIDSASATNVEVGADSGVLDQILEHLIQAVTGDVSNLLSVLDATIPTVESAWVNTSVKKNAKASITRDDLEATMDFAVLDADQAAGGFVGMACGAVFGKRNATTKMTEEIPDTALVISGVRAVAGGEHAGGFFGLAEMGGVAQIAEEGTGILNLLVLNNVDVLNAFRTYFYDCYVFGSAEGMSVYARTDSSDGGDITSGSDANQVYHNGNAGGFGGSLLNATVLRSHVRNLKLVNGLNYVGGFVGLSGKSGVLDLDKAEVLENVLIAAAGLMDIFGSHMDDSSVTGMANQVGYTLASKGGKDCIAGGFIGYGDLSRVNNCKVDQLKQVYSDAQAGGFVGRTSYAYLAKVDGTSPVLLNPLLYVINELLDALYVGKLEDIGAIQVKIPGLEKALELKVLSDGDVLSVTLLGLKISVALVKDNGDGTKDMAQIHIGDSYVEIPCSEDGITADNLKIGLIKANRTKVANCTITGVTNGYDVFGGGATNDVDGSNEFGYAGGFVGFNNEGLLENNTMLYADTIRGTADKVGPFSGHTKLKTGYDQINNLDVIEGQGNSYSVYRSKTYQDKLDILLQDDQYLLNGDPNQKGEILYDDTDELYYIYTVHHRHVAMWPSCEEVDALNGFAATWQDAQMSSSTLTNAKFPVNVYITSAQANLMLGVATEQNEDRTIPGAGDMQDPCGTEMLLTVQKIWFDDGSIKRPEEINVTLLQGFKPSKEGEEPTMKPYQVPVEDQYQSGETGASVVDNVLKENPFQMNSDMVGADPDIWTTQFYVPVRAEQGENGELGQLYTYDVSEETIDGYVTFYCKPDDYTIYILNFQISMLMADDTVVIDYGLPVAVDVLDNDALGSYQIAGELAGVAQYDAEKLHKTFDQTTALTQHEQQLSYGKATIDAPKGVVAETTETDGGSKRDVYYVPDTMQMDSLEKMLYVVKLDSEHVKNDQNYITGALSIIPATEIFYEDNFGAIKPNPGYTKDDTKIVWTPLTGEGSDTQQDTDRPGSAELGKLWDDLYGNDTHYEKDATYSNGTAWYVEVGEDTKTFPSAEFTFTGTGFDVISVTSGETGTIKVNVYDVNQGNKKVKGYIIDTYYGYNFVDGEWVVDESADASNALYQVPVLKVEDLPWGTYKAEIIPTYHKAYDDQYQEGEYNSYRFYLDAIRIYDPAKPDGEHYKEIEEVYEKDGENRPEFKEIRDILLNAKNTSAVTEIGAVFVDGNGALTDIEDYEAYGPKNEVYLAPGQAISFNLETTSKDLPDKLQLSAKLESGSSTQMTIELAVPDKNQQWVSFRAKTYTIETAYDLYYEFGEQCVWEAQKNEKGEIVSYKTKFPIVIRNSSSSTTEGADVVPTDDPNANLDDKVGNLLSLTNLKWTGSEEIKQEGDGTATVQSEENRTEQQDLLVTSSWENVEAAYYLLNPVQQYTVTVKYQDESGNSLAEDQVLQVYDGAEYDATKLLEQAIKGYQFQRVQGEATGVATGDVEIVVIYQKLRMETLQQLIDRANTMVDCAHKYVKTQWEALLDALAAAEQLLSVEHVTQDQVDDTASALLEAIMAQRFQANKENLEAILEQAKDMDLSGYTVESVAKFQAALDAAQAVMDDDSLSEEEQQTVDAATEALAAAMEGLTAETEPEEPEATDAPQTTDAPEVSQQPEATNAPQTTDEPQATPESEAQVPQTGDESGLTIWLTTLFVCAAAGIGMGMKIKTRKEEEQ